MRLRATRNDSRRQAINPRNEGVPGVSLFTLSRRMGTSVVMIDRTYGHLAADAGGDERGLLHDALIYRRQEPVREAGREKRPVWRLEPRRIQGYGPIGGRAPSWEYCLITLSRTSRTSSDSGGAATGPSLRRRIL